MRKSIFTYDCEVYINYFLVIFYEVYTGNWWYFQLYNDIASGELRIPNADDGTLVGFNSINYDMPILAAAANGASNAELKALSDDIIINRKNYWEHSHELSDIDHIDIINVLKGVASLKLYGGRNKTRTIQDLPVDPSARINDNQSAELRQYCLNDNVVTGELYHAIRDQIALRETMSGEYHIDLRSKSDAQIAEAVIASEYERLTGYKPRRPTIAVGTRYHYRPPRFLQFNTEGLSVLLDTITRIPFEVSATGSITMPKELANKVIDVQGRGYKMGIGGLHSTDKAGCYLADEDHVLMDIDVASYYPAIILNNGYSPQHLGDEFDMIYRRIVDRRLKAKKAGDKVTTDALKITINGSFGKLGNKYSKLYSPDMLIHVTLTGQLSLLMLIEQLGDRCVSANTDGVMVRVHKDEVDWVYDLVEWWEGVTNFTMEFGHYAAYYRRDVNNYFSITLSGEVKGKGIFARTSLDKNPDFEVVKKAVMAHLTRGADIDPFIRNHPDITDFVKLRTVKGGGVKNGEAIGKTVRFYWSSEKTSIRYGDSGNTVPESERSTLLQVLPHNNIVPLGLDYDRYIEAAGKLLSEVSRELT